MGQRIARIGAMTRDRRGAVVVEMAVTLPILLVILFGIVSYGSWLTLAHAVQQSANEAARAALVGLSSGERASIADTVARATLRKGYAVAPGDIAVRTSDDGTTLVVDVALDASRNPMLAMPLIPQPAKQLERSAAVRIAGL